MMRLEFHIHVARVISWPMVIYQSSADLLMSMVPRLILNYLKSQTLIEVLV